MRAAWTRWAPCGPRPRSATTCSRSCSSSSTWRACSCSPGRWSSTTSAWPRSGRWSSSSGCWPSASCTPSRRGSSGGPSRLGRAAATHQVRLQLGPQVLPVGVQLRPGLLRHRVHRHLDGPPRLHPPGGDPVRPRAAPGRPAGRVGHPHRQDGPGPAAALPGDAGAQVRDLVRLLLQLRRTLLGLLLGHQGRRPDHPGRRLRARLPAPAGGAAARHHEAAGAHRLGVAQAALCPWGAGAHRGGSWGVVDAEAMRDHLVAELSDAVEPEVSYGLLTVRDLWAGADWHERETWELFGVVFDGHPNLAKLLLPEEFEGFPLRKEFALLTREAKPWPGAKEPGE